MRIIFDFDRDEIRREFDQRLYALAEFMQQNPDAYAVVAGFTDNIGARAYNAGLSRRRAESVAQYLEDKFDISPDRIVSLWYGMMNPVADNSTKEGRRLNRRVEIAVGGL